MDNAEIISLLKWGLGLFGTVVAFVCAAVGFLFRVAYRLGHDAEEIKIALRDLTEIKVEIRKIPVIETRLGTAEAAWNATRSDIRYLLRQSGSFNGHGE
jgi:hypothetical protein